MHWNKPKPHYQTAHLSWRGRSAMYRSLPVYCIRYLLKQV
jgi:hypothetical protein